VAGARLVAAGLAIPAAAARAAVAARPDAPPVRARLSNLAAARAAAARHTPSAAAARRALHNAAAGRHARAAPQRGEVGLAAHVELLA